jgi:hypothetical protein
MKIFSGNQSRGEARDGTPGQPHPCYLNKHEKITWKSMKIFSGNQSRGEARDGIPDQGSLPLVTWTKAKKLHEKSWKWQLVTRRDTWWHTRAASPSLPEQNAKKLHEKSWKFLAGTSYEAGHLMAHQSSLTLVTWTNAKKLHEKSWKCSAATSHEARH